MSKTSSGLVAYAKYQVERENYYWYGCVAFRPSRQLLAQKTRQYPSQYPPKKWTEESFLEQIKPDRLVFDCVGLIKAYVMSDSDDPSQPLTTIKSQFDVSANGLFNLCCATGSINTIPEIPGLIVWKSGHVGVYEGAGWVLEAQGHAQGCKRNRLEKRPFTHWGKLPSSWITYDNKEDTCMVELPILKRGMKDTNGSVTSWQGLRRLYNYKDDSGNLIEVDGFFGPKCEQGTKNVQKKHGLPQTGVVDSATWRALIV